MRKVVTGEEIAQLRNPDPFAPPVWRSPVYQTPGWIVAAVQLARTLWWLVRFLARHPLADLAVAVLAVTWVHTGWPGVTGLVAFAFAVAAAWWWRWRASFTRLVALPARCRWRAWYYRRHWMRC